MAGTELPWLGAAIKYYGYYGQVTSQTSFRNVGEETPACYSNPPTVMQFMAGSVNLFAAEPSR
jgi:hypothetical protein